jgi:hypothetical protein
LKSRYGNLATVQGLTKRFSGLRQKGQCGPIYVADAAKPPNGITVAELDSEPENSTKRVTVRGESRLLREPQTQGSAAELVGL